MYRMIGIYMGKRAYHFEGLDVLSMEDFLKRLPRGMFFKPKLLASPNASQLLFLTMIIFY